MNENPHRIVADAAGAEVADQFEQQQHTTPPNSIQSHGTLLDCALRYASRGLHSVVVRQITAGFRIRLIDPEFFLVIEEQQL
jgi:hypothetical protein